MSKKNIDKTTFCSAPWFGVRLAWDGKYRPCCVLKLQQSEFQGRKEYSLHDSSVDQWLSSDYSQYLRENLTQGVALPECQTCWHKEKHGLTSMRQVINQSVTNNRDITKDKTWVDIYLQRKTSKDYKLLVADVKLSNVCNFTCAMCDPIDSSKIFAKWSNDKNHVFVREHTDADSRYFGKISENYQSQRGYQHLLDMLKHPLTHLKVLGGEPLIDKKLFEILMMQSPEMKSRLNLHFVTNGSQDLVATTEKLQGFRSINYTVSIDGVQATQDYIRSGGDWSEISANILNAKQHGINLTIHTTLQALNVLDLPGLLRWTAENGLLLSISILDDPSRMAISVLPAEIRHKAVADLENLKHVEIINDAGGRSSISSLQDLIIDTPDDSGRYQEFLDYVHWYEKDSTVKLKDIWPEFYDIKAAVRESSASV